jgi:hypothetical protein
MKMSFREFMPHETVRRIAWFGNRSGRKFFPFFFNQRDTCRDPGALSNVPLGALGSDFDRFRVRARFQPVAIFKSCSP